MLARGLLLALVTATSSYKIRRSECWVEEGEGEASTTMVCTCGGIGDPYSIIMNKGPKPELGVPWYGTSAIQPHIACLRCECVVYVVGGGDMWCV